MKPTNLIVFLYVFVNISAFGTENSDVIKDNNPEDITRTCLGPVANICALNTSCITTTTLTVTGEATFDGPVIITNTGTSDSCDSGALVVDGDVACHSANVCDQLTVGGARNKNLLGMEGLGNTRL